MLHYYIQYQQHSGFMKKGSACLEIMPVDAEQWRAEIGNFNGCLHYAVIKRKLNLGSVH